MKLSEIAAAAELAAKHIKSNQALADIAVASSVDQLAAYVSTDLETLRAAAAAKVTADRDAVDQQLIALGVEIDV